MKDFADLYSALDQSNRTSDKVAALEQYFRAAPARDAAWAIHFLIGRRPRRAISRTKMQQWAAEAAGLPDWLLAECYDAVGDLAETLTLILPHGPLPGAGTLKQTPEGLAEWVEGPLFDLAAQFEEEQRTLLLACWSALEPDERFVWNKLMTGAFRVGVSQELVVKALSQTFAIPSTTLAHRLMGTWEPTAAFFSQLTRPEEGDADLSRPYPFCLAHPLEGLPEGDPAEWQAEWKWDGIRAQVIHRAGEVFVWSRGEELITERFPEVSQMARLLPEGTVLDGEVLAWKDDQPRKFSELQKRIGRKTVGKKLLQDVPVVFVAFDVLEFEGEDWRAKPLRERRACLESIAPMVSPTLEFASWDDLREQRARSREHQVEGLMLKRLDSPYRVGRKKGDWWKWKIDPLTVDAVLIYAQRGSGRRASLYTDYTFGLWDAEGNLVPFAKAYSGLNDDEIKRVDKIVRDTTLEKFGPVRTVTPTLVMELAFEGIQLSSRHKSGIAVRFPRIVRWRHDKSIAQADTLASVRAMLGVGGD